MNRLLLAAAAAGLVAATAGDAQAQWGGPPGPPPGYGSDAGYGAPAADKYGFHPFFRKMLWWQKDGRGGCGSRGGCADRTPPYGVYGNPAGMPGTLVFPNHQFNRSPRDFFMLDAR